MAKAARCDVGVLVIHGIGSQRKGSTLTDFTTPLVAHLTAHLGHCEVTDRAAVDGEPSQVLDVAELRQRWLVREAHWADAFVPLSGPQVMWWLFTITPWFVFYFVIRLWRRWGVTWCRLAWGLLSAVAFIGALTRFSRSDDEAGLLLLIAAVGPALLLGIKGDRQRRVAVAAVAGSIIVLLPIAALVMVAVVVLAVLSALPIPKVREKLRTVVAALASSVGDVTAVVGASDREQHMRQAIRESMERLAGSLGLSTTPVVVVAHSHGAALTYRLLREEPPRFLATRRVTLVTYGSAIVPVHVFEGRQKRAAVIDRVASAIGLLALLGLAFVLFRLVSGAGMIEWLGAAVLIGLTVALGVAYLRSHNDESGVISSGPSKGLVALPGTRGGLRWVDLWAAWDPVPNGPLRLNHGRAVSMDDRERRYRIRQPTWPTTEGENVPAPVWPESYLIANDHQPWRDHTIYRLNGPEVIGRFATEIAAAATHPDPDGSSYWAVQAGGAHSFERDDGYVGNCAAESARQARQRRGWWLLGFQLGAIACAAGGITWQRRRIAEAGTWIIEESPGWLRSAVGGLTDAIPDGARDVVAGGARDPALTYGALAFIVIAAIPIVALGLFFGRLGAAHDRRFAGNQYDNQAGSRRSLVVVAGGLLTLSPLAIAAGVELLADDPPQRPQAVPVSLLLDGSPADGTVTLRVLDRKGWESIELDVPRSGASVRLPDGVRLIVTGEVDGGKDCAASAGTADDGADIITVNCAPVQEPITLGGGEDEDG